MAHISHDTRAARSSSWVEIDESALMHNARTLKSIVGERKLGVVVKSNAYGHGLSIASRAFFKAGADWLIVNFAHEARDARAACPDAPIYLCGTLFADEVADVVAAGARTVLVDMEVARALDGASRLAGRKTPVHLKIETGTHRQGLSIDEAVAFSRALASLPGLVLEGLTTHFADIEDSTDHRFAERQKSKLDEARAAFLAAGLLPPGALVHSANSAATLLDPQTHGDLVRVGIAAYGLWPSRETLAAWQERHGVAGKRVPTLEPALAWRARIAQVQDVAAGEYVGYGRTWRATHASKIAVLPIGYHEGFDRRLSNAAHALVHGVRSPVRGRVCMNMTMIDVTDVPGVKAGDVATLIGSDGDERISAEQLAGWMGTIHYEAVTRIHPAQRRIPA